MEWASQWQGGLKGVHALERNDDGHATLCQTESDAKVRTMKSTVRVFSLVIRGPPVDLLWGMLVNARAGAPFLRDALAPHISMRAMAYAFPYSPDNN